MTVCRIQQQEIGASVVRHQLGLVQHVKRIVGNKMVGGQSSFLPLKINSAGVIPIIFAVSLLTLPGMLSGAIRNPSVRNFLEMWASRGSVPYTVAFAILIMAFCYFYTAITFNPTDIADNMKRYGGFVPGVRPGKATAEYLGYIMTRITFVGAMALASVAIFPTLIEKGMDINFVVASFFGGTSLLIMVGVALDTVSQMESHLLMRHYDGFMKKGKIRGRSM